MSREGARRRAGCRIGGVSRAPRRGGRYDGRVRPAVFPTPEFAEYALLDSGDGERLERFASVILRRPDPQALWRRRPQAWGEAQLVFLPESDRGGRWEPRSGAPTRVGDRPLEWPLVYRGATFLVRPTPFKHVGVFPEQATTWELLARVRPALGERPRLLNLFGYTGCASVLAAQSGWQVTHVDASRASLAWLRDNQRASGLEERAIRVLLDDALTFARREARRGSRYEAILLDPPRYGRGPKGEIWRLEEGLAPLVEAAGAVAAERALVVLTTYAVGQSPLTLLGLLGDLEGFAVVAGELALREEGEGGRALPAGFCARGFRGLEVDAG